MARVRAEIRRDGIRRAKRTTLHDSLDSRAPIKASHDSAPLDSSIIYSSAADNFATGRVSFLSKRVVQLDDFAKSVPRSQPVYLPRFVFRV